MKTTVNLALFCIVCLVNFTAYAEDARDDKTHLQGVWLFSSGETNGRSLGELLQKKGLDDLKIKFSGDVMTMTGFGASDHTYKFTLEPMGNPKGIRLVAVETQGKAPKGLILHGIFEIKDDHLKLCLTNESNVVQPKKFEAPRGSGLSVLVLSRQANDDKARAKP